MKKQSAKIRTEIAKLQEQLKAAETREAERLGRIAIKAGLGEFGIDEAELLAAFEELAARFHDYRGSRRRFSTDDDTERGTRSQDEVSAAAAGTDQGKTGEA